MSLVCLRGPTLLLNDLLMRPDHSLIDQTRHIIRIDKRLDPKNTLTFRRLIPETSNLTFSCPTFRT